MTDYGNGYDFLSIWSKQYAQPTDQFLENEEDFIQNSFVFKSFRTEYEIDNAFSASGIKLLKSLKNDENKGALLDALKSKRPTHLENVPGYSRLSSIQKKSLLSKQEMDECFILFNTSKRRQLNKKQLERYNLYRDKINMEQSEYLTLAKNNWLRTNFKRHAETLPEILNMINKVWKISLTRISKYPGSYTQVNLISLVYQCTNPVEMNFLQVVKSVGKPVALFEPALRYYNVNLHSAIKCIDGALDKRRPSRTEVCEVSEDQAADQLARENGVNIVLSSSAFIALLNNHYPSFSTSWDIPITVKEHKTETGAKKTIVYIDKPLPVKSMNISERNKWFCEIACEYVLKYKFKELRPLVPEPKVVDQTQIECNKSDSNEESSSEEENSEGCNYIRESTNEKVPSVATSSHSEIIMPSVSRVPNNEEEVNCDDLMSTSSNSDDGLVIADASYHEDTDKHSNLENETIPHTKNYFVPRLPTRKKRKKKNSKICPQTSYTLWSLKKSSQVMLSKTCSKDLKLLIRCNTGYFKFPVEKGSIDNKQKWVLSTKMEYQSEFGAEAMTLDELTREWGNLYIRPNTKLLRARVNPLNGEVIMFERKILGEVAAECLKLHKVNLMSKLASVYSIMEKLADQPPGRYHLSHTPRNAAFVPLFKECTGTSTFNLQKTYNFSVEEVGPERSPWIPIDVNVLTPTLQYLHKVPAMFTPYKSFLSQKAKGPAKKLDKKEAKKEAKKRAKKTAKTPRRQKKNGKMKKKTATKKNPP